jgi:ACS family pantothenate transporter-like MFS transporter
MALWLKYRGTFSVQQINYFPSGSTAVAIVALLGTAVWTDYNKKRYQVNLLICAAMLVSAVLLLCQDSISVGGALSFLLLPLCLCLPCNLAAIFFAFFLAGISFAGQASNFSWCSDICRDDEQERSLTLASMNMFSSAFNAWWSIVFFPADQAPKWEKGMARFFLFSRPPSLS